MVSEKYRTEVKNGDKKMGGWAVSSALPVWMGCPTAWYCSPVEVGICGTESTGKKMRPLQEKRKRALEELGFLVFCVDSKEMIGGVLHEIRTL